MSTVYADNLHSVNRTKVFIADILHVADTRGMSCARYKVEVGDRLRIAIQALGLSQAEVSRELSVSPSKLGNWLRGANYPDQWFIKRFCDRYGVTTDWIYRGVVSGAASDVAAALWKATQEASEG